MNAIELRFVACPVDRARAIGDKVESIAAGTTTWPRALPVVFAHHDGEVLGFASDMFEDGAEDGIRGIGGRLRLVVAASDMWKIACTVREAWGCSIQHRGGRVEHRVVDGIATAALVGAELEHVALVPVAKAAFGSFTRVWRADARANIEDAPWEIQEFDRKWIAGFHAAAGRRRRAEAEQKRAEAADRKAEAAWAPYFFRGSPLVSMSPDLRRAFCSGMRPPRSARQETR